MKKLTVMTILATLVCGSVGAQGIINNDYGTVVSVQNAKQLEQYVDSIKRDVNANTQDIMTVNNDSVIRDFRLQDQINELKKQGDTTEIRNDINSINQTVYNQGVQIENNKMNIQAQQTQIKNLKAQQKADTDRLQSQLDKVEGNVNAVASDLNSFKKETKKGIATAVAIAGIEYPTYDDEHKFKIAVSTGTYKGETAIAYGVAYTPNYDTIISIKGTDEATAVSVGFNL